MNIETFELIFNFYQMYIKSENELITYIYEKKHFPALILSSFNFCLVSSFTILHIYNWHALLLFTEGGVVIVLLFKQKFSCLSTSYYSR